MSTYGTERPTKIRTDGNVLNDRVVFLFLDSPPSTLLSPFLVSLSLSLFLSLSPSLSRSLSLSSRFSFGLSLSLSTCYVVVSFAPPSHFLLSACQVGRRFVLKAYGMQFCVGFVCCSFLFCKSVANVGSGEGLPSGCRSLTCMCTRYFCARAVGRVAVDAVVLHPHLICCRTFSHWNPKDL